MSFASIVPNVNLLFKSYTEQLNIDLSNELISIEAKELTVENFKFYNSISAMASSKIEGETLDVDSYIKHKMLDVEYLPNLTEKPNDLYDAYLFAQKNELNKENFFEAHKIITKHLLPENQRGVIRKGQMLIMEHNTAKIQYEAASPYIVKAEFEQFWNAIDFLLKEDLKTNEVFFNASLIHLVFENIHPFNDGNGRIGRLLEKWFLVSKLGEKFWSLNSELHYYKNVDAYYKNLQRVGMFYDNRDFSKALPFLLMLPHSLIQSK
jgi:Fic family protein